MIYMIFYSNFGFGDKNSNLIVKMYVSHKLNAFRLHTRHYFSSPFRRLSQMKLQIPFRIFSFNIHFAKKNLAPEIL